MRYPVILADPPWEYRDRALAGERGAGCHYPTLDLADLEALPVRDVTADDAMLFLWATMPLLPEAIHLVERWGFSFKTAAFTWVKTSAGKTGFAWGMGSYTRANAELCLLGTRGKPKPCSRGVHSVILAPRTGHSAKPPEAHENRAACRWPISRTLWPLESGRVDRARQ